MAKIITFTYKKPDGSSTERTVLISQEPFTMFAGTDMSELDEETQALYMAEMDKAKTAYQHAVNDINNRYDVNHRFRQFKPENMYDISRINI